jgi:hypothetical protein
MDPFSLILTVANCLSQWAIAAALWTLVAVYIYRKGNAR